MNKFKGVGTGMDVSPPVLETGAFVPPKIIPRRRKIFYFDILTHLLLFWKRNTASCPRPAPSTARTVWDSVSAAGHRSEVQMEKRQQISLSDFFLMGKKRKKGNVSW